MVEGEFSDEELEKIIEEKVKEELEKENSDQNNFEERNFQVKDESDVEKKNDLSRRDFLKSVGAGTAAAGAMAVLPSASALDFESGNGFSFGNQSSKNFELSNSGNLNLQGGDLQNAGAANVDKLSVGGDGPAESFSEIGGSKGVADAVVTLEGGTPTAFDRSGSQIAQDNAADVVVQAAIDEVESGGGGKINIAAGQYTLQSGITVKSNVTIQGAGPRQTVFNSTDVQHGWSSPSGDVENVVLRDFGQDGNDAGYRTGINISDAIDSWLINLDVRNVGDRASVGDSTPGLRVTGGTRSHIHNCRVERSTSVSIEAAIGAQGCTITNCVVKNCLYNSSVNFIHGISIEKSDNCKIQNCYFEDSGPSYAAPALNANNANNAIVSGNTVKNAGLGLRNANGPCFSNQYVNNNFQNCGITVKAGGSGAPRGTLIANNVVENGVIKVGKDSDADIRNNTIYGSGRIETFNSKPVTIVGNTFRNCDSDIMYLRGRDSTDPTIIANNYTDVGTSGDAFDPVIRITDRYGFMTGNVFQTSVASDKQKATVQFEPQSQPSYWRVQNNYFRHSNTGGGYCIQTDADGVVTGNIFDVGNVEGKYGGGTKSTPNAEVKSNFGINGASLYLDDTKQDYHAIDQNGARAMQYVGDGTTGRTLNIALTPEHVVVEAPDGTMYDVHRQFGVGYMHNAPSGELSITDMGFTVGDSGGDADPNTDGETYTFYAR